ncbi:MAG: hypothetical protein ABFD54_08690 [Armatimonadota bacterium]|nr:hypothetical protein [bacterium]
MLWRHTSWLWRLIALLGLLTALPPLFSIASDWHFPWLTMKQSAHGIILVTLFCVFWLLMMLSSKGVLLWAIFVIYSLAKYGICVFYYYILIFPWPLALAIVLCVPFSQIWVAWEAHKLSNRTVNGSDTRYYAVYVVQVVFFIMIGCLLLFHVKGCNDDWGKIDLRYLSSTTHLQFPPSVRLIQGRDRGFEDDDIFAKLEINQSDILPLINSLPKHRIISHSDRIGISNNMAGLPSWWDPDSCSDFQSIEATSNNEMVRVLITKNSRGRAIIYLEWSKD